MKKKEKRMILILVIVSILIVGIIWVVTRPNKEKVEENDVEEFVQVLEDGTKLNTSDKLKEEKTVDGLKIGNIQLTEKNGQLVLLADVTNPTTKTSDTFLVDITLYDKTGKELTTVTGLIIPIKPGESTQLNAGITEKYANAYDFKVVKK